MLTEALTAPAAAGGTAVVQAAGNHNRMNNRFGPGA